MYPASKALRARKRMMASFWVSAQLRMRLWGANMWTPCLFVSVVALIIGLNRSKSSIFIKLSLKNAHVTVVMRDVSAKTIKNKHKACHLESKDLSRESTMKIERAMRPEMVKVVRKWSAAKGE